MQTTPARRHILNILLNWVPMLLWMAWIYWLSAQPKLPHPGRKAGISDYLFDYSAHAFVFGVLTFLAWRVFAARPCIFPAFVCRRPIVSAGAFSALYAVVDEIHQSFVPGRWANLTDWLADMAGILICMGLLALGQKGWRSFQKRRFHARIRAG